jgi:spermidine/putrescine transport system ATP-binding protein
MPHASRFPFPLSLSFATNSAMPSSSAVEIANMTRRFGDVDALREVTLCVERGEFFSLLGPSGCGKTTLLRIIAGLDFPDTGSLRLGGKEALAIPAHQRAVNTVFQSYALFPHLNVWDNVAFGLRMKRIPRGEMEQRVRAVMELARIPELAERRPAQISGGQRQRVALARALVNEPEVLLLDEPLGALDLKLRKELQQELRALQRRAGLAFIYVTHDQDEALSMSDRIAVMNEGRLVQIGTAADLYERPRTRFAAQFLGGCNLLRATVRRRDGNEMVAVTAMGELRLQSSDSRSEFTVAIRPEKISITNSSITNQFTGVVAETTYAGAETHCSVRVGNETLRVVVVNTAESARVVPGRNIQVSLPPSALTVLED